MNNNASPEFDLFLSYSSEDRIAVDELENWLQSPPRSQKVWRDRRSIPPGAPDYYEPIAEGIAASGAFLLLLSPRWLRSSVAAQEFADALNAGKKVLPVVHPSIPRDPIEPEGRQKKSELMQAVSAFGLAAELNRFNWIWTLASEANAAEFEPVERALATDYAWAYKHAIIVQRLNRWKAIQNPSALLRGQELAELMADALIDLPKREPALTQEQRAFLHESQRHEGAELNRVQEAQARAVAFAAQGQTDTEPDLAMILAAEGAAIAPATEARSTLLSLLHRHARLTTVLEEHGRSRRVSGVAFSPDGRWVASTDRDVNNSDQRPARVCIHESSTGRLEKCFSNQGLLSAVAWGERWLAVASLGSIGWLRWDDARDKFLGNSPTPLEDQVAPDYLAFSSAGTTVLQDEFLAWGTRWGDFGVIKVGNHERWRGQLGTDRSDQALTGLGWLADGRLITAECGRLLARPFPELHPAEEIAICDRVFSLESRGGNWVAACIHDEGAGILFGEGTRVHGFVRTTTQDPRCIAAWCGRPLQNRVLTACSILRSGNPAITLRQPGAKEDILLQGQNELIQCITSDSEGRFLAAGSNDGRVWLWDAHRGSHLVSRLMADETFSCLASSPSGPMAAACPDGRIIRFGTDLGGKPAVPTRAPFPPVRLLFTDEGRVLLAQAEDGRLAQLQPDGTALEIVWPNEFRSRLNFGVSANFPIIAVLGPEHAIAVLRLTQGTLVPICTFVAENPIHAMALDPSGQWLVCAVSGLGVRLKAWQISNPSSPPLELGLLRNGGLHVPLVCAENGIVAAGDGMDLILVPVDDPERSVRFSEHDEPVKGIAFCSDLIATHACWFENTQVDQIRLWTSDGKPLGPITVPDPLASIAFSPDGSSLLALSQKGELWKVSLRLDDQIAIARRIAGRTLTQEEERRYGVDAWRDKSTFL